MNKIVNLTPHTITILNANDKPIVIEPSGVIARREQVKNTLNPIYGIEVNKVSFTSLIFEDKEGNRIDFVNENGVAYIVSSLCLGEDAPRNFYAPGVLIRDAEGKPLGAKGLSK